MERGQEGSSQPPILPISPEVVQEILILLANDDDGSIYRQAAEEIAKYPALQELHDVKVTSIISRKFPNFRKSYEEGFIYAYLMLKEQAKRLAINLPEITHIDVGKLLNKQLQDISEIKRSGGPGYETVLAGLEQRLTTAEPHLARGINSFKNTTDKNTAGGDTGEVLGYVSGLLDILTILTINRIDDRHKQNI
ncbi:hypothetical protein A3A14_02660 [Candidatus Daviesbacteria bacterium RIFCSPLOWO2_01_FULL_43_38]|nr:MAG: hypothetical protein A2874_00580 [Candidatus Daviesbacteria bacterium RIFCSPHIGHO2_01_FULL_43_17]OGE35723.1 MAG: hypothetical protein A3E45_00265 [Candidatus Daviesbacteria bacterium RIFCSPHIGHO2_12_FULL_43_11]OGE63411.1 MAG: hypothetical protein A3A14_02660 [Candidatus Daviesbacteria bacterium RIFCSPLOWO2_01_FULL_43_38]